MRLTVGSKSRLWGVLALTVVAAIAITAGISDCAPPFVLGGSP
jgi:hypothetical protein